MRGIVPPEVDTGPSKPVYASVYMPKFKRSRQRFPASCVELMENEQAAVNACRHDDKRYAALVVGPSKSSEGQFIFYLVRWLTLPH